MGVDREVHDPGTGADGGILAAFKRLVGIGEEPAPKRRQRKGFVKGAQRVLLPTRGTPAGEVAAQLLALAFERQDAEVTRLLVRDPNEREVSRGEPVGQRLARMERYLPDLKTMERDAGQDGIASVVLAEVRRGYDLLVLPTVELHEMRGRPPVADFVDDIVEETPCPLMMVVVPASTGPGAIELSLERILLPVAGRPEDRGSAEVAFSFAANRDTTVEVVHVVSEPEERAMLQRRIREREEAARSERLAAQRPSADRIFRHIKRGPIAREGAGSAPEERPESGGSGRPVAEGGLPEPATNTLREVAERARSMDARIRPEVLISDEPEDDLVELARRGADLIVIACHRRPVRHRAFSGPGIDRILRASPCPVVVTLDAV